MRFNGLTIQIIRDVCDSIFDFLSQGAFVVVLAGLSVVDFTSTSYGFR